MNYLTKKSLLTLFTASAGALLLSACSSTPKINYNTLNAEQIYQRGAKHMQEEDYDLAVKEFQELDAHYPFGPYAQQGDLDTIYAYYKDDKPDMALLQANRFINLYPNNPGLPYAYYMKGVINFDQGASFLQRYFHYDISEHDTTTAKQAYMDFNTFIHNYPKSPYVTDAKRRMVYLRNALAQFQLNVALYNLQKKAYIGAVTRAQGVIKEYPRTPAVKGALEVMIKAYRALGLNTLAKDTEATYQTTYHKAPFTKKKS
ncbi:outer membrane protein assembly factor BamD [Piscirickettsia litoralis]|uniref:Outer membrane protein assembly factor BamD n=1 Tax=Piscirickettsia litoralis TaxID=1891921 RepID=A0ABX2ZZU9_9GAMM|nr:outer membrane protein assembly factor BamD [Piscirickettsia litoralis]ODN42131.1 outer membrane assembly lipoyfio family protein [Piscirickettsia litoralis]